MSNVEDRRDYGAFIPSFLDDFRLDMPSFRLYAHIARRAGSGNCWESIDKMAETCQMNRKTAYKAFKLLQDHKLILVEKRKGQTSLITLTNHCVWIPIPNQVQVSPVPNQVQPCPKSGTPTYTKSGTGGVPNQVHPPIPNQVHKGTPIEVTPDQGTPIEVTPIKVEESIYAPITEISPEPIQPMQQTLIDVLAEEKETPIPPTPLAPLLPENVGLAIATTEKPKKRKRNVTSEDLIPFRDVWNSDAPAACVRFKELTKPDEKALRRLIAEHGDRSLEIFQDGLGFARTQKWWNDTSEGKSLSITNYISKGKPEDYAVKYRGLIERGVVIANAMPLTNTDRPMTPSDINKAEKYLRYKEALTA